MCPLSVVIVVVFVNFLSPSPEPTDQFLENLAQSIHGCRGTKFYSSEGLHPLSRGGNKELWEISWHLNFFFNKYLGKNLKFVLKHPNVV